MPTPLQIVSPCISVCRMNMQSGLCRGCYRTVKEIREWRVAKPACQRKILMDIAQRMCVDTEPDCHERKTLLAVRLRAAGVID